MTNKYDVVVIGSGVAGGEVARTCRSEGRRVALVEFGPFGGTCPLRGCNPKKVLVGASEIVARSSGLAGNGIHEKSEISWRDLMRFKRTFTEPVSSEVKESLSAAGIDLALGTARFVDENAMEVDGKTLTGDRICIAVGARPRKLNIPGEDQIITSDQFLDLDHIPSRVVFIGSGYISFEFAHVAARAGAQVTILHRSGQVLKGFDPQLVDMIMAASREIGIQIHDNAPVRAVEYKNGMLMIGTGNHGFEEVLADMAVHGAGRVPAVERLNLRAGGVDVTEKGISVNSYMQSTSNPSVYVAGDVAATPLPLTPTASLEATVAARNILEGNRLQVDYSGIPSVVFTYPPLARVGMLEHQLKDRNVGFDKRFEDTSSWFSSKRIGLNQAGAKVLISKASRKILGAHILGNHAEEVINVFALAIRLGLTVDDLKQTVWTYPSSIYEIKNLLG